MSHLYRRPPKNGIYWLAYYINGKRYQESLRTRDLANAKYLKSKKDQEILQGKSILPNQNNLCWPVFKSYKEFKSGQRNPGYNQAVSSRIEDFLKWRNIQSFKSINEDSMQQYLNYRINQKPPISPSTANHIIRDIREFIRYAIKRGIIEKDPLADFKRITEQKNLRKFFTKDELTRLFAEAANPSYYADGVPTLYPLILTAAYTGLRKQELFSLEWKNIDFNDNIIKILNKPNFQIKTARERIIPIHPHLKKELLKLKAKSKSGYCFDATNWRRLIDRILRAAGLRSRGVGFHTLRHSFASNFIMDTKDIKAASEILGHENISTTMIYTHTLKEHLKKAMKSFTLS